MIVDLKLEEIPPLIEEIVQLIGDLQAEVQVLRRLAVESGAIAPEQLQALVEKAKEDHQEALKAEILRRAREKALKERRVQ